MRIKTGISGLLAFAMQALCAQNLPSAGGPMQPLSPAFTAPKPDVPALAIEPSAPLHSPSEHRESNAGVVFVVKGLRVTGARVFSEAELVKASGFVAGRSVNLQALYAMAEKITRYYQQNGYLVARAYLPAQEVIEGELSITVLEGQYGQVKVSNTSGLNPALPLALLGGLKPGEVIARPALEKHLLLLSEVPGVRVRSSLVPGHSVGVSDLMVDIVPGPVFNASVDADNAGSPYTGVNRIGATVQMNNPAGQGDLLTLRGLTSGAGLGYARVAYQTPVGRGQVGLAYSELAYDIGQEFSGLQANGQAHTASVFGFYPLIYSGQNKLKLGGSLDSKRFLDRRSAVLSVVDKRVQVATLSLVGEQRGLLGVGGLSHYFLAWSLGKLQAPSTQSLQGDAAAFSRVRYNKLAFAASHQQPGTADLTYWASLSGQVGSRRLDVSEKMALGGMNGVRAYAEGEAYADDALLLTLEVRKPWQLITRLPGRVHVAAFVDVAVGAVKDEPGAAPEARRQLSAAGVGLYWTRSQTFSVKAFYAWKWGHSGATSATDHAGRFGLQAVRYF